MKRYSFIPLASQIKKRIYRKDPIAVSGAKLASNLQFVAAKIVLDWLKLRRWFHLY